MISTASSYLSANDKRAHFGLGKDTAARLIEITWPSGTVQKLENVKADQIFEGGRAAKLASDHQLGIVPNIANAVFRWR